MTAKVGYLDPVIGRCLEAEEVAAIATIQSIFTVDALSPTVNADCLALWETICEWSSEGKDFASLDDLIRCIKKQQGFANTGLNDAEVYDLAMYYADFFEHLNTIYGTLCQFF
jgi:hypothetical protein